MLSPTVSSLLLTISLMKTSVCFPARAVLKNGVYFSRLNLSSIVKYAKSFTESLMTVEAIISLTFFLSFSVLMSLMMIGNSHFDAVTQ